MILSTEQLTLLRLRGNKVDLENVRGGCEPLRDDQPRQGNLCDEWSQLILLTKGQELEHYKKIVKGKTFLDSSSSSALSVLSDTLRFLLSDLGAVSELLKNQLVGKIWEQEVSAAAPLYDLQVPLRVSF